MTDLIKLRELAGKATLGPWMVSDKVAKQGPDDYLVVRSDERWISLIMDNTEKEEEDAAFIAAANPATIIALIDALEAANKRIAELEQQAEFDRKLQQLNRRDY